MMFSLSYKQIFKSITLVIGIMPNLHALMVPLLNKDGERLAFNKADEFIVDQAAKKQIFLQLTHLGASWNTTKEGNYNCVRLMCGKSAPTAMQQQLISKVTALFIYLGCYKNPVISFFSNQLSVIDLVNNKTFSQKTPNIISLVDEKGQKVFLGSQNKPIFFKFFCEDNQASYNKVVLMCGDKPATAEEQKLITNSAEIIKSTIYKQKETDRTVLVTFGNFYTQLMIMNSPSDRLAFSILTNQDTTQKSETIFEPMSIFENSNQKPEENKEYNTDTLQAKNPHETLTLTHITIPHDFQVGDVELKSVIINNDTVENPIDYQNGTNKIHNIDCDFQTVCTRKILSIYELSLYEVGDIIFTNSFFIDNNQINVQQCKAPSKKPAWAFCQNNDSRFTLFIEAPIKIDTKTGNLTEQLKQLTNAAHIKKLFNNRQTLSFLIGLKYDIWLEFKIEKGQNNKITVLTTHQDDNINVTENPIIKDICRFLLEK